MSTAKPGVVTNTSVVSTDDWTELGSEESVEMMQTILLAAAEGSREVGANKDYKAIRKWLMSDAYLKSLAPNFVISCRDLSTFWSYIKANSDQWEPRRQHIRDSFGPIFEFLEEDRRLAELHNSADWTGITSRREKITAAKAMLPVAQAALENLIQHFEVPGSNGGPPLDEHSVALQALKDLQKSLGEVIDQLELGINSALDGDGLVVEASRFARRAARALRSDPMPYAAAGLILAILSACGFPGLGGYLSGIAANMRKNSNI